MTTFFNLLSRQEKFLLALIFAIYSHNLFIDIMQVDAMQYASISLQMADTNSYLEVKEFQNDYLDKPPLLFWLSSISIKLFGVSNFAYKFPTFLFLLLSLFAVYKLALLYYPQKTAKNALLILASAQAYFLMTNDVRTDGLLCASVITATWLFAEYFTNKKLVYLIIASFFAGLALLAKGPIGGVAVLLPIGIHLLYLKNWNSIFNARWLLVFVIIVATLIPMSIGLYTQFDLHPEKITNGVKGQSGLHFYYWLQSFGRITGENVWNNNKPWHFFIGSSAWDFFPWFLPLLFALFYKIKNLFIVRTKAAEMISLSGFVLIFMMLSLSKYKLPHYVFVTFPFAAILVADYFAKISKQSSRLWRNLFVVLSIIILFLISTYFLFFFTEINYWLYGCLTFHIIMVINYFYNKNKSLSQLILLVISLNVFMSLVFYPKLLTFQADSIAAKYSFENLQNEDVYLYNKPLHAFSFYTQNPFNKIITKNEINSIRPSFWVYATAADLAEITTLKANIIKKIAFQDYPITRLKLNFLLEYKRATVLDYKYLIKIENKK